MQEYAEAFGEHWKNFLIQIRRTFKDKLYTYVRTNVT